MIKRIGIVTLATAIFSAFFLTALNFSWAEWYQNGERVPDTNWRKSHDDFGAMILLTKRAQDFLKAWDQPTEGVPISVTQRMHRGEKITAFISFMGCRPNETGLCNVIGDFIILKPDGSTYGEFPQTELWKEKPAPLKDKLGLGTGYAAVEIEPDDPLGKYIIKARVQDLNGNITLELEQDFIVAED